METRANYVLVGAFTLLILFAAGLCVLWMGGKGGKALMVEYDIFCTASVRGLSVNSDVYFNGIKVGTVADIKISRGTPGEVRIRISIDADTPVREDSLAQLDMSAITGISVVSISGGSAQSPLIHVPKGGVGVIRYEPSTLLSAATKVYVILISSRHILKNAEQLFSVENLQAVSEILDSLAQVAGTLADRADSMSGILLEAEKFGGGLNALLAAAHELLGAELKQTSAAVAGAAKRADSTLEAIEPGLRQFSTQGLADLRMLMMETRSLVHVLTRIGQKLENDPRRFLFGDSVQEYQNR